MHNDGRICTGFLRAGRFTIFYHTNELIFFTRACLSRLSAQKPPSRHASVSKPETMLHTYITSPPSAPSSSLPDVAADVAPHPADSKALSLSVLASLMSGMGHFMLFPESVRSLPIFNFKFGQVCKEAFLWRLEAQDGNTPGCHLDGTGLGFREDAPFRKG